MNTWHISGWSEPSSRAGLSTRSRPAPFHGPREIETFFRQSHYFGFRRHPLKGRRFLLNCPGVTTPEKSTGYEDVAAEFIAGRGGRNSSGIGASAVAEWSQTLPAGATVLDLGCGTGIPISQVLIERGFKVFGVDASPTIVAAFRTRFPNVPVDCADVDDSDFFARTFDGVVAWGLFFLLTIEVQRRLIKKVAAVLQSGGRLLFTAPTQTDESGCFPDIMTGRPQFSLGYEEYRKALEAEGMFLVGTHCDEGKNHYYLAQKK